MNKYRHTKSSLFLIEIMINILFFTVLASICLQLFFKANRVSRDASLLHHAVTACTSIAEVYQSNLNGRENVLTIYPDAIALNSTVLIYFDKNYLPCKEADSYYRVVLEHGNLHNAKLTFYTQDDSELIYDLSVSSYVPRTLQSLEGDHLNENN